MFAQLSGYCGGGGGGCYGSFFDKRAGYDDKSDTPALAAVAAAATAAASVASMASRTLKWYFRDNDGCDSTVVQEPCGLVSTAT